MCTKTAVVAACLFAMIGCSSPRQVMPTVSLQTNVSRQPWNSPESSGQILTTRHYRIYTTATRPETVRNLPGFMEAARQNFLILTGLPDRQPDGPLTVYMMATRPEWALLTENVVGKHKDMFLSIQAGGYFYNGVCVFWDMGGPATFSVASHEGLHQFLAGRLRDRLPMWLEEGLCVMAEGHEFHGDSIMFTPNRNPSRFMALRTGIIQDHWLPLAEILPMDAGDAVTKGTRRAVSYYGQLWALNMFISSHPTYSLGLKRLLADAESGRLRRALGLGPGSASPLPPRGRGYNRAISERVFRRYITEDLKAFDAEWLAFAMKFADLE